MNKFKRINEVSLNCRSRINIPKMKRNHNNQQKLQHGVSFNTINNQHSQDKLKNKSAYLRYQQIQQSKIINKKQSTQNILINFTQNKKQSKRYETEQNQYQKQLKHLKHYITNLNHLKENKFLKKQDLLSKSIINKPFHDCKNFMMSQISFTKVQEQKIIAQKNYLQQFDLNYKSLPKKLKILKPQFGRIQQQHIQKCHKNIDRIYRVIKQMQREGYSLKTSKFIIQYCKNKPKWLKSIFLFKLKQQKKSLQQIIKQFIIPTSYELKSRITQLLGQLNSQDMQVVQDNLKDLHSHLQHFLSQKKIVELANISKYIESTLFTTKQKPKSLRFISTKQEKLRITQDINLIEQKFGAMPDITKLNRQRHQKLNLIYEKLQRLK